MPSQHYDLNRFALSDMFTCGAEIRQLGAGVSSMEEAAQALVKLFYNRFRDDVGDPACALVRCFKTHEYGFLQPDLQKFADAMSAGAVIHPSTRCLTLLATAGEQPDWNDRNKSIGHKAIPLLSPQMVSQAPMINQLIQQLGLDVAQVLSPDPSFLVDVNEKTFNVFHVPEAPGSPFVPVQSDFVLKYHVKSVLGFGGMLPNGDLFAVILFSKVFIPRETADLFATLALGVKLALLPFVRGKVFAQA